MGRTYKVLEINELKNVKQYKWFKTFSNPCYGLNVKMDVSKVVEYSKKTSTSFFINLLYLITIGLSSVEETQIRTEDGLLVWNEINNAASYEVTLLGDKNYTFTTLSLPCTRSRSCQQRTVSGL